MDEFLKRLKERKLVQWSLAYAAGAFALLQGLDIVAQQFGWPEGARRGITIALMIGFFIALVLAWYHGERGAQRVSGTELLIIALLLAIGGGVLWRFVRVPVAPVAAQAKAAPSAKVTTAATASDAKSIAVLAFANMSADKDNEYFADGIAEEILNALAHLDGLKVAGRTSSFQFKGKNENLASIGQALGVAHVLEGSVRKQGDKVRITAQLIRVQDGFHLWSETYDGGLQDVFALQEKIARSITDELKVVLSGKQAQQLVHAGTANPEAYALYLQASATFNRRDSARFAEAFAQLEQATTLDPRFARAYARLAALYAVALNGETVDYDAAIAAAEKFAHRAAQLDPTLAEPDAVLGLNFRYQRKHREGAAAFARALALEPDDVTTNFWWAITLTQTGYRRQGIAALDRTLQIDPLLPNALFWRAREHIADGELDQGERLLRRAAESGHGFVGIGMAQLERARGNRDAAVSALATGLAYFTNAFPAGTAEVFARACFGDAQAKTKALALIDAHLATKPAHTTGVAPYVLIHVGEPARALTLLQSQPTTNDGLVMGELFSPAMAPARRLREFPEFLRRMGLAAYWDEAGPPDQCRKGAKGDYVCE